jgi:hypothetical protein
MNEEDLRDCFAMFAMMSYWKDGDVASDLRTAAAWSYDMADAMMEARKPKESDDEENVGIASVAKRSYRRKS